MSGPVQWDGELPLLTFEAAVAIETFPAFDFSVSRLDIAEYVAVTGDENDLYGELVPPGFAAVFGRGAYLQGHRMPSGGILLGQDIQWLKPVRIGEHLRVQARLTKSSYIDPKRTLWFLTEARRGKELVARIRIVARWPL
ncbi:MAG: hypothetical protein APF78_01830 [Sphingomonadales bacterium BRH_c3]|nr:MAG: hypothetical protein APF78_01830 [Sphingomonadales bacterium BRH_c3]